MVVTGPRAAAVIPDHLKRDKNTLEARRNYPIGNTPCEIIDDGLGWLHKLIVQNDTRVEVN